MSTGVPLIARVAGLPARAMVPFASDLCRCLERAARQEAELDALRDRMIETLHEAVPGADRIQRRLLLAVRRACFQRQPLGALACGLAPFAGPLAAELAEREEELRLGRDDLEQRYLRQCDSERRALMELLVDAAFLRGVALASPALAAGLTALRGRPAKARNRRQARLETSLLRYASRAALKLSPFSTLTRAALGRVDAAASGVELRSAGAWQERSRVRLDRRFVDLLSFLLCRHPVVRAGLPVLVNETLEPIDAERHRFLRPGGWRIESGRLEHAPGPGWLGIRLAGPLVPAVIAELTREPATYGELLLRLEGSAPSAGVDDLLDAGILRLAPSWAGDDLHFEERLLESLEGLRDPELAPLADLLRQSLRLLASFPDAPSPSDLLTQAGQVTGELLRQAVQLGGAPSPTTELAGEHPVQEDVFLRAGDPEAPEVLRIAAPVAEAVLRDLEPLVRLSDLDSRRHDLLHTLAAFARQRWPSREEIGLLDFLHAARPLFRAWLDFERQASGAEMLAAPAFNPLGLAAVEILHQWRKVVRDGLGDCLETSEGEQRLCRDSALRLLGQVPAPYAAAHSVCAFVQPLDGSGVSWVLNRFFEGSGRLSSRYTAVMDEEVRDRWTAYYTARSVREQDGETGELVDLFCPLGSSLNVHALQTRRILDIPGESSPVPPTRSLRLRDLRVRLTGPHGDPRVVDTKGRHLLPVHLGGRGSRFLPELLKLMTLLGPGELRPCLPRKRGRREGDLRVGDRHRVGRVVYARRTWAFDTAALRTRLADASAVQAFAVVNRWRLERQLPDRVFLAEPVARRAGPPRRKPQYIDFTSPLFVEIFRSAVEAAPGELEIAEALPDPEGMLRGADGSNWAVEVQLDNLGFQPGCV